MKKKGQIEVTFNWIYIAIAGAVILLFFFGIVVRQKQVSEERLSSDVVRIMESILTGAGVSEKTKNFIDASGLADYTLYFSCSEGVSEFGIKDRPARTQNPVDPLFAPREMQSPGIVTWSLPYSLPFKVIDFLLIIPSDTKYFITGNNAEFINEFLNATEGIAREYVLSLDAVKAEGKTKVRVIDTSGTIVPLTGLPSSLQSLPDSTVSAVVFTAGNLIDFYQKKGNAWQKLNKNPLRLVSLGGERDAAKYAAIFSGDDQIYWCNLLKALRRLEMITQVYGGNNIGNNEAGGKLKGMITYYEQTGNNECSGQLEKFNDNLKDALAVLHNGAAACRLQSEVCINLVSAALKVKEINNALRLQCTPLY